MGVGIGCGVVNAWGAAVTFPNSSVGIQWWQIVPMLKNHRTAAVCTVGVLVANPEISLSAASK